MPGCWGHGLAGCGARLASDEYGASGGVTAVFILFVLYYPRQTVYFLGLLAMPAWVIGAIVIGLDLLKARTGKAGNVAWQAALGRRGVRLVCMCGSAGVSAGVRCTAGGGGRGGGPGNGWAAAPG